MNGNMAEAQTRHAKLEDVDVETFQRFCEFVYLRGYKDPEPEDWDKYRGPVDLNAIENIAVDKSDVQFQDLFSAPPATSSEVEEPQAAADQWFRSTSPTMKKVKKEKRSKPRIMSTPRAETDGYIKWYNAAEDHFSVPRKELITQAFSARSYEISYRSVRYPSFNWEPPSRAAWRNFGPVFQGHARLYVFADKYCINDLKSLVLHKLHAILDGYAAVLLNMLPIIELIKFVFDNENTPDLENEVEPLRGLLGHYAATQLDGIRASRPFRDLLEGGGPFVSLFWSIIQRTIIQDI